MPSALGLVSFAIESFIYDTDFTQGLSQKITFNSSYNWFIIDILRLLQTPTALFNVYSHVNYYVYIMNSSNYVQNAFWQLGSDSRWFLNNFFSKYLNGTRNLLLHGKCHFKFFGTHPYGLLSNKTSFQSLEMAFIAQCPPSHSLAIWVLPFS